MIALRKLRALSRHRKQILGRPWQRVIGNSQKRAWEGEYIRAMLDNQELLYRRELQFPC